MLETAVDRFGRPVGCAGPVEVGQDVGGPLLECASKGEHLLQGFGDAGAQRGISAAIMVRPVLRSGCR